MSQSVAIIGGGLAGLAAASVLAPRGHRVTILEARSILGGRASSFLDRASNQWIDNCQHVSMRCCTNLADFCERVGIESLLTDHPVLFFQNEREAVSKIRTGRLPAPFHQAASFAAARFLSWTDKLRIAYGIYRLMRQPTASIDGSFLDWLLRNGQTTRTCERYWGLVLTSALNESLDRIDYRYGRQVFVEGFLSNRRAPIVQIPSVPLSELYGARLTEWLAAHGAAIRLSSAAEALEFDGPVVRAARLRSGGRIEADRFILAVPFHRVGDLLPAEIVESDSRLSNLSKLESSPITSVHLWYDRPVMRYPHLTPVGRAIQWLFVRSSDNGGQYVQAVISASRKLAEQGNDHVREIVEGEVGAILPAVRHATLLRSRVVTERLATFSVLPGVDRNRPSQKTSIPNLYLAGDYTQTEWPATMEGAVRGGYLAAEKVLADLGRGEIIVKPALPRGLLARLLIR